MPRGKPRVPTNIRLDPDLKAEANALAALDGKKLNNVIEALLRNWVRQRRKRTKCRGPGTDDT